MGTNVYSGGKPSSSTAPTSSSAPKPTPTSKPPVSEKYLYHMGKGALTPSEVMIAQRAAVARGEQPKSAEQLLAETKEKETKAKVETQTGFEKKEITPKEGFEKKEVTPKERLFGEIDRPILGAYDVSMRKQTGLALGVIKERDTTKEEVELYGKILGIPIETKFGKGEKGGIWVTTGLGATKEEIQKKYEAKAKETAIIKRYEGYERKPYEDPLIIGLQKVQKGIAEPLTKYVIEPTKGFVSKGIEVLPEPLEKPTKAFARGGYEFLIKPFETEPLLTGAEWVAFGEGMKAMGGATKIIAPKIFKESIAKAITSKTAEKLAIGGISAGFGTMAATEQYIAGKPLKEAIPYGVGVAIVPPLIMGGAYVTKKIGVKAIKSFITPTYKTTKLTGVQATEEELLLTTEESMIKTRKPPTPKKEVYIEFLGKATARPTETELINIETKGIGKLKIPKPTAREISKETFQPKIKEISIGEPIKYIGEEAPLLESFKLKAEPPKMVSEFITRQPYTYERVYPKTRDVYDIINIEKKQISMKEFEKKGIIPKIKTVPAKELGRLGEDRLGEFDPYGGKKFAPHITSEYRYPFGKEIKVPTIKLFKETPQIRVRKGVVSGRYGKAEMIETPMHERVHALSDHYKQIGYVGEGIEKVPAHIRRGMARELRPVLYKRLISEGYKGKELLEEAYAVAISEGYIKSPERFAKKYPYTTRVFESIIKPQVISLKHIGKKTEMVKRKVEVPETIISKKRLETQKLYPFEEKIKEPRKVTAFISGIPIKRQYIKKMGLIKPTVPKEKKVIDMDKVIKAWNEPPVEEFTLIPLQKGKKIKYQEIITEIPDIRRKAIEQVMQEPKGQKQLLKTITRPIEKTKKIQEYKPVISTKKITSKFEMELESIGKQKMPLFPTIRPTTTLKQERAISSQFKAITSIKSELIEKQIIVPSGIIFKPIIDITQKEDIIQKVGIFPKMITTQDAILDITDIPPYEPPPEIFRTKIPAVFSPLIFPELKLKKEKGRARKYEYAPSAKAVGEKIFGTPKPLKVRGRKYYTGMELRPMIKGRMLKGAFL